MLSKEAFNAFKNQYEKEHGISISDDQALAICLHENAILSTQKFIPLLEADIGDLDDDKKWRLSEDIGLYSLSLIFIYLGSNQKLNSIGNLVMDEERKFIKTLSGARNKDQENEIADFLLQKLKQNIEMWSAAPFEKDIIINKINSGISYAFPPTYNCKPIIEKLICNIEFSMKHFGIIDDSSSSIKKDMPKVLLFFADSDIGAMYQRGFVKGGFNAKFYNNYVKPNVVDLVASEKPDILICDIVLPGKIDGYDAIKLLKEDDRTKDFPIIILSNLASAADQAEGLRLGAAKYFIMAHNSPEKILEEVKSFLLVNKTTESANQQMHYRMNNEAKSRVAWAFELYQSFHAQYPELPDREIFGKMLDQRGEFPGGDKDREIVLDRYGSSLNGLCYYLGLNSPLMKDTMIFRCIQFTEYIDIELEKCGVKKPSDEIKRQYFKTLDLPEEAATKTYL